MDPSLYGPLSDWLNILSLTDFRRPFVDRAPHLLFEWCSKIEYCYTFLKVGGRVLIPTGKCLVCRVGKRKICNRGCTLCHASRDVNVGLCFIGVLCI